MTVNNPPNSSHPQTASTVDVSNVSPSSGGPQTLADLKKQRSMNRVAQQSSPQAPTRDNSHGSERGQASMSAAAASASSRPSSHHKQGSSMRNKSNGERGLEDQQRPHHSKRNNSGNKNGRSRGQGGHRGSNNSNASSANVKKFTHSEVVGPPPKKTGCCRVMWDKKKPHSLFSVICDNFLHKNYYNPTPYGHNVLLQDLFNNDFILVLAAPPCMLLHCQKTEFDNFWSILYHQTFYTVELTCYWELSRELFSNSN